MAARRSSSSRWERWSTSRYQRLGRVCFWPGFVLWASAILGVAPRWVNIPAVALMLVGTALRVGAYFYRADLESREEVRRDPTGRRYREQTLEQRLAEVPNARRQTVYVAAMTLVLVAASISSFVLAAVGKDATLIGIGIVIAFPALLLAGVCWKLRGALVRGRNPG